jgi:hypothetical protein
MVSNTQNYWVPGLCPLFGIINTGKHTVSETGCFRPQGMETHTLLGCLKRANPNQQTSFSGMVCFLVFRIPDGGQSPETQ